MSSNYNEDYLNGLIAKAEKSWEGVDVDSFMSDLRDMDAVIVKCRDLMVGDWCCSGHGLPMQITNVGENYAYATWEGNEGDSWEFDDKDDQPQPIEITTDLLKANGWILVPYSVLYQIKEYYCVKNEENIHLEFKEGEFAIWLDYENNDGVYSDILIPCKYVHQLQQALRLAGLTDMANNFKV